MSRYAPRMEASKQNKRGRQAGPRPVGATLNAPGPTGGTQNAAAPQIRSAPRRALRSSWARSNAHRVGREPSRQRPISSRAGVSCGPHNQVRRVCSRPAFAGWIGERDREGTQAREGPCVRRACSAIGSARLAAAEMWPRAGGLQPCRSKPGGRRQVGTRRSRIVSCGGTANRRR